MNYIKRVGINRLKRYMLQRIETGKFQNCMLASDQRWIETQGYLRTEFKMRWLEFKINIYRSLFNENNS